jgi:hypothetical protein
MNTIIRKETVASALPDDLRGNIDPANAVRVQVEDLGRKPARGERVLALAGAARHMKTSVADAVARIRELRDDE